MPRSPSDTPLMRQYLEIKQNHPDAILFFRLGDFYEMFFEDAVYVARTLELQLTTRDRGREDAVPMCGVPHHSARDYIAKLLDLGHRVAVCEQVEDPRLARGIVRREVTRILTPGVILDPEQLDPKTNHFFGAVVAEGNGFGLAFLDVSTGDFIATAVANADEAIAEMMRIQPREVIGQAPPGLRAHLRAAFSPSFVPAQPDPQAVLGPLWTGPANSPAARAAAWALEYARTTQPGVSLPISTLVLYQPCEFLRLDESTRCNLELFETLRDRRRQGSLLGVIDCTETAPGGRLLRSWLAFPLADVAQIRRRQDGVEMLVGAAPLRTQLREALGGISDIARISARAQLGGVLPRELGSLRASLESIPALVEMLMSARSSGLDWPELLDPPKDTLADLASDLRQTLADDLGARVSEGGVIREGVSVELDEVRELAQGGKAHILVIEARERERTGIASLKIKYSRVFGYCLEVTRAQLEKVPQDYIRKQTLAGVERFVTPELTEYEIKVLQAEERKTELEQELYDALCARVARAMPRLLGLAHFVATLDALSSLAEVAHQEGYVRPQVLEEEVLEIEDGRHPVVEKLAAAGSFVPNDIRLDVGSDQILIITGPNMAGKSTIMRQVALIQILGQMGSFVPARAARLGLCDRIFTRVGAADDLGRGQSTFMVEMQETAHILAHATRKSLVILDEIGRGTSTYDGISIAWSVAEHLHEQIGCRTLFATHYHELCLLGEKFPRIHNWSVAVREWKGEVVFLHKFIPGGASRSYGIDVAALAGLPRSVLTRARQLLAELESDGSLRAPAQLALFDGSGAVGGAGDPALSLEAKALLEELRQMDSNRTTPLEALQWLIALQRRVINQE